MTDLPQRTANNTKAQHLSDHNIIHEAVNELTESSDRITANRQTGNYTLLASDVRKVIEMNVAGANTLTLPPDVFIAGDFGEGVQWGAGQTTITPGAGVSIRSEGDKYKTNAQYASFTWRCVTPTEFHIAGSLAV